MSRNIADAKKHGGFWWSENETIDHNHIAKMGAIAWAVYCVMARHANDQGVCHPSAGGIELKTGLGKTSVYKAIKSLATLGYIKKLSSGNSKGESNVYQVIPIRFVPDISPDAVKRTGVLKGSSRETLGKGSSPRELVRQTEKGSSRGNTKVVRHAVPIHPKDVYQSGSEKDAASAATYTGVPVAATADQLEEAGDCYIGEWYDDVEPLRYTHWNPGTRVLVGGEERFVIWQRQTDFYIWLSGGNEWIDSNLAKMTSQTLESDLYPVWSDEEFDAFARRIGWDRCPKEGEVLGIGWVKFPVRMRGIDQGSCLWVGTQTIIVRLQDCHWVREDVKYVEFVF